MSGLDGACGNCLLLALDLDGFRTTNEGLGQEAGDQLLCAIARRLRNVLEDNVFIARYGGDEFVLVAHHTNDSFGAAKLANRVLRLFDKPFDIDGYSIYSSASIGVASTGNGHGSPRDALRNASLAMSCAKQSGKARVVFYDKAMHANAEKRFSLRNALRRAFEQQEFLAYYQPIVDLRTGETVGSEALIRWRHSERGLLLPGDFLGPAEETGVIFNLDWWMLEETCRRLREWKATGKVGDRFVAHVNADARQLADPYFVMDLRETLSTHQLEPSNLALEVTETIFRDGNTELIQTLGAIKALGIALVADDVGTGYSSLESLVTLPFDTMKIDRCFVQDMHMNCRHHAIVQAITLLARDLDVQVVAEGVECAEQIRLLLCMGCSLAQGFLFSPAAATT